MTAPNGRWPLSSEDEVNLCSSRRIFEDLATLLHAVTEARYVEPLGGFDITS